MDHVSAVGAAEALDRPSILGGQSAAVPGGQGVTGALPVRILSTGENLFHEGDPKTQLHKIATGLIGVYRPRLGRVDEIIEFAFPGDVLGLGYLDHHIHTARALVTTRVQCFRLASLDDLTQHDVRANHRHADAVQREFAYRRDLLTSANRQNAIGRVAAFLLAISDFNADEGHDPAIVSDTMKCGVVAEWLKLDLDDLQRALVELEKRCLIAPSPGRGIRLLDLQRLEVLAGGSAS
jgi:CRP/FNR family transcriptional regulator